MPTTPHSSNDETSVNRAKAREENRSSTGFPLPPIDLAARVDGGHADAYHDYERLGARMKDEILALLPRDWSFDGKTVLDFGCGAGRTLRHFGDLAETARFLGCDIDAPSVAWLQETFTPTFEIFLSSAEPPLELGAGSVDLVWALSVFTHLTDNWSDWLVELHRILADDGLLVVTFIGPGTTPLLTDEPWDENRIGMNVLRHDQGWELGGPMVMHSPWWIRAHWSRGFEILALREHGFATRGTGGQGVVLMKKRKRALTKHDLQRIDPGEPREIGALLHQVEQLRGEVTAARAYAAWIDHQATAPQPTPPPAAASRWRRLLPGSGF